MRVSDRETMLRFEEHDGTGAPTGRFASFLGVEFSPLQYADLVDKRREDKVVVPLRWDNARISESNIPEIVAGRIASGGAILESENTSRAIGLINGGGLPSGLALRANMTVLSDRCTITDLRRHFRSGERPEGYARDFIDHFAEEGVRINPLLWALEGNRRRDLSPWRKLNSKSLRPSPS